MHSNVKIVTNVPVATQNQAYLLYAYVFRECLKVSSEMNRWRSSDNKVFPAAGPHTEKARGQNVDVSVTGFTSWSSSTDQSQD